MRINMSLRYSKEFKMDAVEELELHGYSPEDTAKRLDIKLRTLLEWIKKSKSPKKRKKNILEDIIMKYLESKENYIHFNNSQISLNNLSVPQVLMLSEKIEKALVHSHINIQALKPSEHYVVKQTYSDNMVVNLDFKINSPQDIESFEVHNSTIFDALLLKSINFMFAKYSTENNKIIQLHFDLFLEFFPEEVLIAALPDNFDYKYKYSKVGIDSEVKDDLKYLLNQIQYDDSDDYAFDYIKNLRLKYKNLKESGIFYPVKFQFNIFDNDQNFLFEINHYKFWRTKAELESNKNNFYQMLDKKLHAFVKKPENYIESHATKYDKNISYFNPFILLEEKFKDQFLELVDKIKSKKVLDHIADIFIQKLNHLQFIVIDHQQRNLINDIFIFKAHDKQNVKKLSIHEFIQESIKHSDDDSFDPNRILVLQMMDSFFNQNEDTLNYKNITIEDLGFKEAKDKLRHQAGIELDKILFFLNKKNEYTLKNMHISFSKTIIDSLKSLNLKISKKDKDFIKDIIAYIITNDITINLGHEFDNTALYNKKYIEVYNHYIDKNNSRWEELQDLI